MRNPWHLVWVRMLLLTAALVRFVGTQDGFSEDILEFLSVHRTTLRRALTIHKQPQSFVNVNVRRLTLGRLEELHAVLILLCELEKFNAQLLRTSLGEIFREHKKEVLGVSRWLVQLLSDPAALNSIAHPVNNPTNNFIITL